MKMLKTFYWHDRLKRVDIYELELDGVPYFSFREETWFDYEHENPPYSYWGPHADDLIEGYYESAEAAEADCIASTPWLRETSDKR